MSKECYTCQNTTKRCQKKANTFQKKVNTVM